MEGVHVNHDVTVAEIAEPMNTYQVIGLPNTYSILQKLIYIIGSSTPDESPIGHN